ncbi:hypothetical protein quinque_008763 [Culex quinquefasciatus]
MLRLKYPFEPVGKIQARDILVWKTEPASPNHILLASNGNLVTVLEQTNGQWVQLFHWDIPAPILQWHQADNLLLVRVDHGLQVYRLDLPNRTFISLGENAEIASHCEFGQFYWDKRDTGAVTVDWSGKVQFYKLMVVAGRTSCPMRWLRDDHFREQLVDGVDGVFSAKGNIFVTSTYSIDNQKVVSQPELPKTTRNYPTVELPLNESFSNEPRVLSLADIVTVKSFAECVNVKTGKLCFSLPLVQIVNPLGMDIVQRLDYIQPARRSRDPQGILGCGWRLELNCICLLAEVAHGAHRYVWNRNGVVLRLEGCGQGRFSVQGTPETKLFVEYLGVEEKWVVQGDRFRTYAFQYEPPDITQNISSPIEVPVQDQPKLHQTSQNMIVSYIGEYQLVVEIYDRQVKKRLNHFRIGHDKPLTYILKGGEDHVVVSLVSESGIKQISLLTRTAEGRWERSPSEISIKDDELFKFGNDFAVIYNRTSLKAIYRWTEGTFELCKIPKGFEQVEDLAITTTDVAFLMCCNKAIWIVLFCAWKNCFEFRAIELDPMLRNMNAFDALDCSESERNVLKEAFLSSSIYVFHNVIVVADLQRDESCFHLVIQLYHLNESLQIIKSATFEQFITRFEENFEFFNQEIHVECLLIDGKLQIKLKNLPRGVAFSEEQTRQCYERLLELLGKKIRAGLFQLHQTGRGFRCGDVEYFDRMVHHSLPRGEQIFTKTDHMLVTLKPSNVIGDGSILTFHNLALQHELLNSLVLQRSCLTIGEESFQNVYQYAEPEVTAVGLIFHRTTKIPQQGFGYVRYEDGDREEFYSESNEQVLVRDHSKSAEESIESKSILYDSRGKLEIVDCSPYCWEKQQICYYGFEQYERLPEGWDFGGVQVVRNGFAGSGQSFGRIGQGGRIVGHVTPKDLSGIFRFVCLVRPIDHLVIGEVSSVVIATIGETQLSGRVMRRNNSDWYTIELEIFLEESDAVQITISSDKPLEIDHFWFGPLDFEFKAKIYDTIDGSIAGEIDRYGRSKRFFYDLCQRQAVATDFDGKLDLFVAFAESSTDGLRLKMQIQPKRGFVESFEGFSQRWRCPPTSPLIRYYEEFVDKSNPFEEGTMRGLVHDLNPALSGFPYYRYHYAKAPVAKQLQRDMPGTRGALQELRRCKVPGVLERMYPREEGFSAVCRSSSVKISDDRGNTVALYEEFAGVKARLSSFAYDAEGRMIAKFSPLYHERVETLLRGDGWKLDRNDQLQQQWGSWYEYDREGRVVEERGPDKGTVRYRYEGKLHVEKQLGDEKARMRALTVDSFNGLEGLTSSSRDQIWRKLVKLGVIIEDNVQDHIRTSHGKKGRTMLNEDIKCFLDKGEDLGIYYNQVENLILYAIAYKMEITREVFFDFFMKWNSPINSQTYEKKLLSIGDSIWTMLSTNRFLDDSCLQALSPSFREALSNYAPHFRSIVRILHEAFAISLGTSPADVESYDIDSNGNHGCFRTGSLWFSLSYSQCGNRLESVTVEDPVECGPFRVRHDERGNVVEARHKGIAGIEYDMLVNRASKVILEDGRTVQFWYNSRGERVLKRVEHLDGSVTERVYARDDKGRCLVDYNSSYSKLGELQDQVTTYYIYDDRRLVGFKRDNLYYNVLTDHEGSIRLVLLNGQVMAAYDYMPYGQIMRKYEVDGRSGTIFRFTGQEYDEELKLYNYHARLYDPELGRFLQVDPLEQYASPYKYAGNSPLDMVDPDGRFAFLIPLSIVGGAYLGGLIYNSSAKPWEWDWHSRGTYLSIAGGAATGGIFSGILGLAGTGLLLGAYLGGASAEDSWFPRDWKWDKSTWFGIFAGGASGVLLPNSWASLVKSTSATQSTLAMAIFGGVVYAGGNYALNWRKFKSPNPLDWDWSHPGIYYRMFAGLTMSINVANSAFTFVNLLDQMTDCVNVFGVLETAKDSAVVDVELSLEALAQNRALLEQAFPHAIKALTFFVAFMK